MRINGWQRIGIVLSITWIIGAGIVVSEKVRDDANAISSIGFDNCRNIQNFDIETCSDQKWEVYKKLNDPNWSMISISALAPVFGGWLFVYMMLGIYRWVRRGFTNPPKP